MNALRALGMLPKSFPTLCCRVPTVAARSAQAVRTATIGMRNLSKNAGQLPHSAQLAKRQINWKPYVALIGLGITAVSLSLIKYQSEKLSSELSSALKEKSVEELGKLFASEGDKFLSSKHQSQQSKTQVSIAEKVLSSPVELPIDKRIFLIKQIAGTEAAKKMGWNPLHIAVLWDCATNHGKTGLIAQLIKSAPEYLYQKTNVGLTPAELAVVGGRNEAMLQFLIQGQLTLSPYDRRAVRDLITANNVLLNSKPELGRRIATFIAIKETDMLYSH